MLGGVPHQGGLPDQPVRVIRFGGLSIVYVKVAERGNPPNRGNQITTSKPAKTHGRTTWLPTAKTLIKLTVVATIIFLLLHFGPHPASPGLHVETSISLPRIGGGLHLCRIPCFHLNRPLHCVRNTEIFNLFKHDYIKDIYNILKIFITDRS